MAATSEVEMASTSMQIILSDRPEGIEGAILQCVGSGVTAVLLQHSDLRQVLTYARFYTRNIWGAHH